MPKLNGSRLSTFRPADPALSIGCSNKPNSLMRKGDAETAGMWREIAEAAVLIVQSHPGH